MDLIRALQLGLGIATLYAIVALLFAVRSVSGFPRKKLLSKAVGAESDGIKYAFTYGMLPSAKESVRLHMPTFVGGILYHLGVFTALAHLPVVVFKIQIPPALTLSLRLVMLAGLVSGIALLVKRVRFTKMRIISTPDDYIANILVDLFLALSIAVTMTLSATPLLLISAIILLIYIPIGKIRHCVFFFFTRINFGRLFGRRGVLPHANRQHARTQ